MCGGGGRPLAGLDAGSAKKSGIIQIVAGGVAIIFSIAATAVNELGFSHGTWGGVVFILCGVFSLLASAKRDLRWTTVALISAIANTAFSIFVFSTTVTSIYEVLFTTFSPFYPTPTPYALRHTPYPTEHPTPEYTPTPSGSSIQTVLSITPL